MNVLISFFAGLTILLSGDEISSLLGYEFIAIICNIFGVCLMGVAGKKYLETKQEEIEYQKRIENNLLNLSEKILTASDMTLIVDSLKLMYEEQMKIELFLKESISTIDIKNNELSAILKKQTEELLLSSDKLLDANVSMKDAIEKVSQVKEEKFKNIIKTLEALNELPQELWDNTDELTEKINDYTIEIKEQVTHFIDDIEVLEKRRIKDLNNVIDEMKKVAESFEILKDQNIDLEKEYAKQYQQFQTIYEEQYKGFQKIVENFIKETKLMSENDMKMMKGFLNE